jgi:hypothetical protein
MNHHTQPPAAFSDLSLGKLLWQVSCFLFPKWNWDFWAHFLL